MVFVRATATALFNFLVHRPRDKVARCQVFKSWGIALHKPLAIAVEQNAALSAHAFGNQHARARDARGVELPELHVFERNARTGGHAHAIAGIDKGIGRGGPDTAGPAGGKDRDLSLKHHDLAGLHFERNHPDTGTFAITNNVKGHPFHKELRAGPDIALIEGVQERMAGAVGGRTGPLHGLFAQVGGVPAKRPLIDGAVGVAVKRHAKVLKLIDHLGCLAAHKLNGVLVTEVVRPFYSVKHVPVPVVLAHVAQRRANTALGRYGV